MSEGSLNSLRSELLTLLDTVKTIEIDADAIHSELTSNSVCKGGGNSLIDSAKEGSVVPPAGLSGPLIDTEGFPRSDIDVYHVKNQRRRLRELNTDHKDLMRKVESLMSRIYKIESEQDQPTVILEVTINDHSVSTENKLKNDERMSAMPLSMFLVDSIANDSPATVSGLKLHDEILQFGNISYITANFLIEVSNLVANSVGQTIPVMVKREGKTVHLELIPKAWSGRGLLGCHLTPINH